jgi:succinate-semialdehyde dehydrogenase / glutarate-semialdehyde dehydrogenase
MIARKVAPALAAGCAVVVKPSEFTPFSAFAVLELGIRAGVPAELISCITGDPQEIGKEFTSNPLIRKISFTGSTRVGKLLLQQCAQQVKRVTMELGGNAPFIVFEDADLEKAAEGLILCKFRNAGQTCVAANRIFVHDSVYDEFVKKFVEKTSKLIVGRGTDDQVKVGPLINLAAVDKVAFQVKDAVEKGAKIAYGGSVIHPVSGGYYHEPTILTNVTSKMLCFEEETFGPLAPIHRFTNEEQVVQMANDSSCGLAAYYYTKDLARIFRLGELLDYGMHGVNTGLVATEVAPFGGLKESGMGREGSKYGIQDYMDIKYSCINLN